MSEDTTRDLSGATPFEQRVLAELTALRQENVALRQEVMALRQEVKAVGVRLTSLEEKVDARLRETRPVWEGMQTTLNEINSQMRLVVADLFKTRARVEDLEQQRA